LVLAHRRLNVDRRRLLAEVDLERSLLLPFADDGDVLVLRQDQLRRGEVGVGHLFTLDGALGGSTAPPHVLWLIRCVPAGRRQQGGDGGQQYGSLHGLNLPGDKVKGRTELGNTAAPWLEATRPIPRNWANHVPLSPVSRLPPSLDTAPTMSMKDRKQSSVR